MELLQFARLAAASRLPLRLTAAAAPLRHCDLELCGQTRSCTHIIASIVGYVPPLNCWWIRHHCIESRESLRSARRGLHREIVGAVRRRSRNLCLKGLSYVRACMRVHTCDPALRCRAPKVAPKGLLRSVHVFALQSRVGGLIIRARWLVYASSVNRARESLWGHFRRSTA